MNILYITSRAIEINASSSIRNIATIKGLIENGNNVTVVSMKPDEHNLYYDTTLKDINVKRIYFTPIVGIHAMAKYFRLFNIYNTRLYKFLRKHVLYDNTKQIISHLDKINVNDYDLVISSSDPKSSHLFVEELFKKKKKKIKWIQIWGDPFALDITLTGNEKFIMRVKKEEERLLLSCDSIIYVSKATLETQMEMYPFSAMRMHYTPIPFLHERIYEKSDRKESYYIAYCGDYSSHIRNIMPLYDALMDMDNFVLTICGDSDVVLKSTDNIDIKRRLSYDEVYKIEDKADILVMICNLSGTQIPGKTYQIAGTNKPILFILDGEKDAIRGQFECYNRFVFCNNNIKDIKEKLLHMVKSNEIYMPIKDFSPKMVAKNILNTLE